jgi:hypothetical protein
MSSPLAICEQCGASINGAGALSGLCPHCILLSNFPESGECPASGQWSRRVLDHKYRMERPLGHGGMGSVFRGPQADFTGGRSLS